MRAFVLLGKVLYALGGVLMLSGGAYCAVAEGWDALGGFFVIVLGVAALVMGAASHGLGVGLAQRSGTRRVLLLAGAALAGGSVLTLVTLMFLSTFVPMALAADPRIVLALGVTGLALLLAGALLKARA